MLSKFWKMIYAFPQTTDIFDHLLNDAIDLHIQVVKHHRNLAGTEIRQRPVIVVGLCRPDSGNLRRNLVGPNSGDQDGRDLARTAEFQNLARTVDFQPTGRDSAVLCRIPTQMARFWPPSPEFGQPRFQQNYLNFVLYRRNLAGQ